MKPCWHRDPSACKCAEAELAREAAAQHKQQLKDDRTILAALDDAAEFFEMFSENPEDESRMRKMRRAADLVRARLKPTTKRNP